MSRSGGPSLAGAVGWPEAFAGRYRAAGLWRGQTVAAWLDELTGKYAELPCLVDGELRLDYRSLGARVRRLARGFERLGVLPLERVVVQLPNGVDVIETLLALMSLGAVPVLALPAHRRAELRSFCTRARAAALVFAPQQGTTDMLPTALALREMCPDLRYLVASGEAGEARQVTPLSELRNAPDAPFRQSAEASEVALLQLSGGSTGTPKLIARTHDDYLYSVRASAQLCELSPATRFLAALPITHNFTLSSPGVLGVLHAGGTIVTCAEPRSELVLRLLVAERITLLAAVPSLVRAWLAASPRYLGERKLPELLLQVGGAKLDEALARAVLGAWGCKLQQVFGMAEGLVNYTRPCDDERLVVGTQGRPLSEQDEVRVVSAEDPEGPSLPRGELGELQTRGPYTIRGYFGGESAASFTRDGFYRTGDLVRQRLDGYLCVEGRLGDRILRGGEKISPLEVEDHLREHEAVADVAVVGVPDEYLGEKSHAFVTLRAGNGSFSTAAARAFLRQRGLAEFKLPDAVHVLAELPRTRVGKTDRVALRARAHV